MNYCHSVPYMFSFTILVIYWVGIGVVTFGLIFAFFFKRTLGKSSDKKKVEVVLPDENEDHISVVKL